MDEREYRMDGLEILDDNGYDLQMENEKINKSKKKASDTIGIQNSTQDRTATT